MKPDRTAELFSLIDEVLPPEENAIAQEISGLIMPQLELIVELNKTDLPHTMDYYDSHHMWFPRADYKTVVQKSFRRLFVLPVNRAVHEELHATMDAPKMPSKSVMLGYIALLSKKGD